MSPEQETDEFTQCIRCDADVSLDAFEGLTLTFKKEMCAVKLCEECQELAGERNHY